MPNANISPLIELRRQGQLPGSVRAGARVFVGVYGLLLCVLFTPFAATRAHAEEFRFPGLEALMTDEEFARAGLNELTPAQRAELNRWLSQRARFKLEETPAAKKQTQKQTKNSAKRLVAKPMSLAERTAVKPIRTRIVGKFKGWSGTTLFRLENGEYWKQRQAGRYYHKAESPEVELFKNRFGFWEIRILETGKTVKVSRYEP